LDRETFSCISFAPYCIPFSAYVGNIPLRVLSTDFHESLGIILKACILIAVDVGIRTGVEMNPECTFRSQGSKLSHHELSTEGCGQETSEPEEGLEGSG
jgi:hypothetical protein